MKEKTYINIEMQSYWNIVTVNSAGIEMLLSWDRNLDYVYFGKVTVMILRACFCSTDCNREAQNECPRDHERGAGHVR